MRSSEKAKRTLVAVMIPRDELAFRIAQQCIGATAPAGTDATEALDAMARVPGAGRSMAAGFRAAADAAVSFLHECIEAGRQPS